MTTQKGVKTEEYEGQIARLKNAIESLVPELRTYQKRYYAERQKHQELYIKYLNLGGE